MPPKAIRPEAQNISILASESNGTAIAERQFMPGTVIVKDTDIEDTVKSRLNERAVYADHLIDLCSVMRIGCFPLTASSYTTSIIPASFLNSSDRFSDFG